MCVPSVVSANVVVDVDDEPKKCDEIADEINKEGLL